MPTVERNIAMTITAYLTARGDRIACDHGTLILYDEGGRTMASLDGETFVVTLRVTRRG